MLQRELLESCLSGDLRLSHIYDVERNPHSHSTTGFRIDSINEDQAICHHYGIAHHLELLPIQFDAALSRITKSFQSIREIVESMRRIVAGVWHGSTFRLYYSTSKNTRPPICPSKRTSCPSRIVPLPPGVRVRLQRIGKSKFYFYILTVLPLHAVLET